MDDAIELRPYLVTYGANTAHLDVEIDVGGPLLLRRIEAPEHARFCRTVNKANVAAFGGATNMGMPLWVMLDCAILPSAIVGFAARKEALDPELLARLGVDDSYQDWVPVTEYCGSASFEPGVVSGFSLHSHLPGRGLALRTKALAMVVYRARRQIGVTQVDNPAVRVHTRFGPLEVLIHRPAVHTHSQKSFVYSLQLPERAVLLAMARGDSSGVAHSLAPGGERIVLPSPEGTERLDEHLYAGGSAQIVYPGLVETETSEGGTSRQLEVWLS